jgi:hypothetical protein
VGLRERTAHRIALLQGEIQEFYAHFHVTRHMMDKAVPTILTPD